MSTDRDALDAAADELYGLPVSEFTAARDRHAADARQAGDRELAARIKKLRRPTVSAWLTNQLVRQKGDEVAALLRLGSALRDAQAHLATDDLRRLSQQAQQVVTALGRDARQVAQDAGQRIADGAVHELEETLHAALADPAASDEVQAGHLTSALSYAGFGSVDVPAAGSAASRASARALAASHSDDEALRQAQAESELAELADARQDASGQERRLDEARQRQARLEQRVQEVSEELERLRAEASEAATTARDAARASREAARRLARAEAAVDARDRA
jgi:hypothetical protein